MTNKIAKITFLLIFLVSAVLITASFAEETKPKTFWGTEFLVGAGTGNLKDDQGHYNVIPMFFDLDFNLKPHLKILHLNKYPGLIQGVIEPFVSYVFSPNNNAEIGNNFLIKIGFLPDTWKFQVYFKGGVGMLYMTQHTREQGTQFNFNEYGGFGMHYFFKENVAFTIEYRFRHISNCDIDERNSGINTHMGLCGITYQY